MAMYDVAVIGGGPGGYAAALSALKRGGKVVVVEAADVGGTCVNRGCIPSKVWLRAASYLRGISAGAEFGVKATLQAVDLNTIVERKDGVAAEIRMGMEAMLQGGGVELVRGTASLTGRQQVAVGDEQLEANAVVIATGSRPVIPDVDGLADAATTTDDILQMTEVPASVLVLGGGPVEVEMTCILRAFGADVYLAAGAEGLLPLEDDETSQRIARALFEQGVEVFPNLSLGSVQPFGELYEASLTGPKEASVQVATVLVCSRKPNLEGLGVEAVGVELDDDGSIRVNDNLETTAQGVFAVGDVTGGWMLSHAASAMGNVAGENAMGQSTTFEARLVPRGLWAFPEMGSVGLTEEEAEDQGIEVEVGDLPYAVNGLAMAENEVDGSVKIVADAQYGEILGVHIVGARATELIGDAVLAMQLEVTAQELAKSIRLHPAYSETLVDAARAMGG
jgi:dihydrolipoamide dehydrogenase